MTENTTRVVIDRARDPWTVETTSATAAGGRILRFRHEMGYELTAVAPRPVHGLTDREVIRLLEGARLRAPRSKVASAA